MRNYGAGELTQDRVKAGPNSRPRDGISEGVLVMTTSKQKIGWIGVGRMGLPMAERLLKAEPLSGKGGKIVDKPVELADCDIVFAIVSTGKDVEEVIFGKDGLLSGSK